MSQITPKTGALEAWLKDQNKTLKDLHDESGVDPKTIRKISKGDSVRYSVLQRLCTKCKIPEHLLLEDQLEKNKNKSNLGFHTTKEKFVTLSKQRVDEVLHLLSFDYNYIVWHLKVNKISDEQEEILNQIENIKIDYATNTLRDSSPLKEELLQLKAINKLDELLNNLEKTGLILLSNSYNKRIMETHFNPYEDYITAYEYYLRETAVFAITNRNQSTLKVEVDPGDTSIKPLSECQKFGITIIVDGETYFDPRDAKKDEIDEDIPF